MKRLPISLIIDDPAPVVSVYYTHLGKTVTEDGRPLLEYVPNSLLDAFCDVVERNGIKGKYSVIPMPGNRGDIVNGIDNVDMALVKEWIDTVQKRLVPAFTVGPEMLTHNWAVDLATGKAMDLNERDWASTQDRTTLTPYITRALELLRDAGFDAFGVTSPWDFGIEVEDEYAAAISKAVYDVTGRKEAWYFLRGLRDTPNAKAWIQLEEEGRTLVAIPATTFDRFWQTINCDDTSDAYVSYIADQLITADGKDGQIIRALEMNAWPIFIAHWQSLVSNGLGTGIRALDEVGKRIRMHLSDRVEWMSFEEIMHYTIAEHRAQK